MTAHEKGGDASVVQLLENLFVSSSGLEEQVAGLKSATAQLLRLESSGLEVDQEEFRWLQNWQRVLPSFSEVLKSCVNRAALVPMFRDTLEKGNETMGQNAKKKESNSAKLDLLFLEHSFLFVQSLCYAATFCFPEDALEDALKNKDSSSISSTLVGLVHSCAVALTVPVLSLAVGACDALNALLSLQLNLPNPILSLVRNRVRSAASPIEDPSNGIFLCRNGKEICSISFEEAEITEETVWSSFLERCPEISGDWADLIRCDLLSFLLSFLAVRVPHTRKDVLRLRFGASFACYHLGTSEFVGDCVSYADELLPPLSSTAFPESSQMDILRSFRVLVGAAASRRRERIRPDDRIIQIVRQSVQAVLLSSVSDASLSYQSLSAEILLCSVLRCVRKRTQALNTLPACEEAQIADALLELMIRSENPSLLNVVENFLSFDHDEFYNDELFERVIGRNAPESFMVSLCSRLSSLFQAVMAHDGNERQRRQRDSAGSMCRPIVQFLIEGPLNSEIRDAVFVRYANIVHRQLLPALRMVMQKYDRSPVAQASPPAHVIAFASSAMILGLCVRYSERNEIATELGDVIGACLHALIVTVWETRAAGESQRPAGALLSVLPTILACFSGSERGRLLMSFEQSDHGIPLILSAVISVLLSGKNEEVSFFVQEREHWSEVFSLWGDCRGGIALSLAGAVRDCLGSPVCDPGRVKNVCDFVSTVAAGDDELAREVAKELGGGFLENIFKCIRSAGDAELERSVAAALDDLVSLCLSHGSSLYDALVTSLANSGTKMKTDEKELSMVRRTIAFLGLAPSPGGQREEIWKSNLGIRAQAADSCVQFWLRGDDTDAENVVSVLSSLFKMAGQNVIPLVADVFRKICAGFAESVDSMSKGESGPDVDSVLTGRVENLSKFVEHSLWRGGRARLRLVLPTNRIRLVNAAILGLSDVCRVLWKSGRMSGEKCVKLLRVISRIMADDESSIAMKVLLLDMVAPPFLFSPSSVSLVQNELDEPLADALCDFYASHMIPFRGEEEPEKERKEAFFKACGILFESPGAALGKGNDRAGPRTPIGRTPSGGNLSGLRSEHAVRQLSEMGFALHRATAAVENTRRADGAVSLDRAMEWLFTNPAGDDGTEDDDDIAVALSLSMAEAEAAESRVEDVLEPENVEQPHVVELWERYLRMSNVSDLIHAALKVSLPVERRMFAAVISAGSRNSPKALDVIASHCLGIQGVGGEALVTDGVFFLSEALSLMSSSGRAIAVSDRIRTILEKHAPELIDHFMSSAVERAKDVVVFVPLFMPLMEFRLRDSGAYAPFLSLDVRKSLLCRLLEFVKVLDSFESRNRMLELIGQVLRDFDVMDVFIEKMGVESVGALMSDDRCASRLEEIYVLAASSQERIAHSIEVAIRERENSERPITVHWLAEELKGFATMVPAVFLKAVRDLCVLKSDDRHLRLKKEKKDGVIKSVVLSDRSLCVARKLVSIFRDHLFSEDKSHRNAIGQLLRRCVMQSSSIAVVSTALIPDLAVLKVEAAVEVCRLLAMVIDESKGPAIEQLLGVLATHPEWTARLRVANVLVDTLRGRARGERDGDTPAARLAASGALSVSAQVCSYVSESFASLACCAQCLNLMEACSQRSDHATPSVAPTVTPPRLESERPSGTTGNGEMSHEDEEDDLMAPVAPGEFGRRFRLRDLGLGEDLDVDGVIFQHHAMMRSGRRLQARNRLAYSPVEPWLERVERAPNVNNEGMLEFLLNSMERESIPDRKGKEPSTSSSSMATKTTTTTTTATASTVDDEPADSSSIGVESPSVHDSQFLSSALSAASLAAAEANSESAGRDSSAGTAPIPAALDSQFLSSALSAASLAAAEANSESAGRDSSAGTAPIPADFDSQFLLEFAEVTAETPPAIGLGNSASNPLQGVQEFLQSDERPDLSHIQLNDGSPGFEALLESFSPMRTGLGVDMDASTFLMTLSPELRNDILLTADESLLENITPELYAEAMRLRRSQDRSAGQALRSPEVVQAESEEGSALEISQQILDGFIQMLFVAPDRWYPEEVMLRVIQDWKRNAISKDRLIIGLVAILKGPVDNAFFDLNRHQLVCYPPDSHVSPVFPTLVVRRVLSLLKRSQLFSEAFVDPLTVLLAKGILRKLVLQLLRDMSAKPDASLVLVVIQEEDLEETDFANAVALLSSLETSKEAVNSLSATFDDLCRKRDVGRAVKIGRVLRLMNGDVLPRSEEVENLWRVFDELMKNQDMHQALLELVVLVFQSESGLARPGLELLHAHSAAVSSICARFPELLDGSLAAVLQCPGLVPFSQKREVFQKSMNKLKRGKRSHGMRIVVRRRFVVEDSFRQIFSADPEDLFGRFSVHFSGEEGIDAGGVSREWFGVLAKEIFNPNFALFKPTASDALSFQPNPMSYVNTDHLLYFEFIGRVFGKALLDGVVLNAFFTRSFYKHILGQRVTYKDMEEIDPPYYKSLEWILVNDCEPLDLSFAIEADEFGQTVVRDLVPHGRNRAVTNENKKEYVQLVTESRMTVSINSQITSFLKGFRSLIPEESISMFDVGELQLLLSGTPSIDLDDWKKHTDYVGYSESSEQVIWFWEAVESFSEDDRARLLQFVTGSSRLPLEGFSALPGISGVCQFQIHRMADEDRLPSAHTCFNSLDLPAYESSKKLRKMLLFAIREGCEGFGFV